VAADAAPEVVTNAIEAVGFIDEIAVKVAIGGNAAEYNAFKIWANNVKVATGDTLAGEAAVVASPHAAAAYLLGAERLLENEPTVEIEELNVGGNDSVALTIGVAVKDGEKRVMVDTAKIATMFEATSDLGDWTGAAKLTPTVTVSGTDANGKMSFIVAPSDGTVNRAFLRIHK